jgi:hypothetical protein
MIEAGKRAYGIAKARASHHQRIGDDAGDLFRIARRTCSVRVSRLEHSFYPS